MSSHKKSHDCFQSAKQRIPGGVNSPVRAFNGVGGEPVFFDHAQGAYLYDVDGNRYIDYVASWGPMITGHANREIIDAVSETLGKGLSFGAPTEIETEMAEAICNILPSMDLVRMVSSGTEATMSAIRLARGFTERDTIIKFEGCYHGHADSLLVKAGSGALTMGVPTSPGVPESLARHTLTLEYNNSEQLKEVFAEKGDEIACVIVEPVAGNMNCIPPEKEFLQTMRELCSSSGAVLIFDEVMTGFRVSLGGAQAWYGIDPDLTTLGKIIGGGMPVGAFGGKSAIMEHIAPLGPVYQAGTLSGNPVAMRAGLTILKQISASGFYEELESKVDLLLGGLTTAAKENGIPFTTNQAGSMFGFFFTNEEKVSNFRQVSECNVDRFRSFYHGMLEEGVYLAPSAYEAGFMSSAHTQADIEQTIAAAGKVMAKLD